MLYDAIGKSTTNMAGTSEHTIYYIYIYILNVPVLLFVNVEKRSPRHMKKLLELQDVGFNGR